MPSLAAERDEDCGLGLLSPIPSLHELVHLAPDRFVVKYTDIAAVNLACARALPNADESEFPQHLNQIDTIADAVRPEAERSWRLFKLKPAQFNNSEAVFRLSTMEHVFRVRFDFASSYDMSKPWIPDKATGSPNYELLAHETVHYRFIALHSATRRFSPIILLKALALATKAHFKRSKAIQ